MGGPAPHVPAHRGQHSLDGGCAIISRFADERVRGLPGTAPSPGGDTQATPQTFDRLVDWTQGSFRTSMEDVPWIDVNGVGGQLGL